MSNKKLLFFDIDGTLITNPPELKIPDSTIDALQKAQKNGHLIFINTGRSYSLLPSSILELGFDGFVCGCGTQVYLHNQWLLDAQIEHNLCAEVNEALKKYGASVIYECTHRLLYDSSSPVKAPSMDVFKVQTPIQDIASFSEKERQEYTFTKFLAVLGKDADHEGFLSYCQKYFECFSHGHGVYEIVPLNYSKATGIQFLLDHLNLSVEDSYAFGDGPNDLAMLKYAGTSIAMGNARDEILPYCTYQTTAVDKDGIYNAMKHFELI